MKTGTQILIISLSLGIALSIFLFSCSTGPAPETSGPREIRTPPFSRGVNLTDYFQAHSVTQIQYSGERMRKDLENIKSLGCDVVRLPIRLHSMTSGAPEYELDSLFLRFLDETIDIAEETGIALIIDNHTFDPAADTQASIKKPLLKVWAQLAQRYSERSSLIYYEVLNEPHGISSRTWGKIQGEVIEEIRKYDSKHTIIVGPADWNSYNSLKDLPDYDDPNLVYTFHFYDPFLFTHQGASWSNPSLENLAGVPFPADAGEMPEVPGDLKGTWIEDNIRSYNSRGTAEYIKERLDIAVEFGKSRNEALFCGEFGVYNIHSDPQMRAEWYGVVRRYLEEHNIAWTIWDYRGGFGFFEKEGEGRFDSDLDAAVVKNLGLTMPPQVEPETGPVTEEIVFYSDSIGPGLRETSYTPASGLSYYETANPAEGEFCIEWTKAGRYKAIRWSFPGDKDFSYLLSENYVLEFQIKSDDPGIMIDVRFMNPGTAIDELPWRMGTTIDSNDAEFDGSWQRIRIPLQAMQEKGAWKDEWFDPAGEFDWTAVDALEFVTEHKALGDSTIYLDEVRITEPESD